MEENYKPGSWGIASFKYLKNGIKSKYAKNGFTGGVTAFGQVKAVEKRVVLFEDDFQEYIIDKKSFKFEPGIKPVI